MRRFLRASPARGLLCALAPGIRLSTDPLRKTIAGDAQPAEQTNVYIDGVSQKNDVLQGGLVGQDSSRGNSSVKQCDRSPSAGMQRYIWR